VIDEEGDPADIVKARESVRLALVAALQLLPPRQRAALILCDVLSLTPAGAAEVLDVSVAALKSLLQRARTRLANVALTDQDLAGKATCVPYLSAFAIGSPGDWEMVALHANGQLGAAAYHRGDDDGAYYPFAVVVLATTTTHLKRISLFTDHALFTRFDLPAVLPSR
jgi:RNA polymerase sigma-70 factor, ECF subfamily